LQLVVSAVKNLFAIVAANARLTPALERNEIDKFLVEIRKYLQEFEFFLRESMHGGDFAHTLNARFRKHMQVCRRKVT